MDKSEVEQVIRKDIPERLTLQEAINVVAQDGEGFHDYIVIGVKLREHKITHEIEADKYAVISSLDDLPKIVKRAGDFLSEHYQKLAEEKEGR